MSEKKTPKPDDLLNDAADWQPDTAKPAKNEEEAAPEAFLNPEGGNDYVSFIDDPFGIRTLEIADAQKISEELDLDEDLSLETDEADKQTDHTDSDDELPPLELSTDDAPLENLAKAMAEEVAKLEEVARQAASVTDEDRAKELAAQIAEDQALSEQMAREQAEADQAIETDPELLAALPQEPQPDANGNLDLSEIQSCIETLLFMVDKPVSAKRLKELLGAHFSKREGENEAETEQHHEYLFVQALEALQTRYAAPSHGIELVNVANGWQLRTKAGRAALAKKLSRTQVQRLSSGGMETLAIVAYRQPVLKEEIDKIRGVDSSYFVRGLLDRKLITISGRSELPGRPMLYSTSEQFLELFGLKDLSALPSLREIEQMVPQSQSNNPDDVDNSDPRVREMRRLVATMKADTSTTLLYDPKEDEKILSEIRERVKAIPSSTPYLDEQKAMEKAAKEEAGRLARGETAPPGTQLDLNAAVASESPHPEATPEAMDIPPPESIDEPEPSIEQI